VQELQLTTLGQNIIALEVAGTFDDCQAMVKQAFSDEELNQKLFLTSANSINVARWLPQQFYYFYALQQWKEKQAPVVCVPSGNFGNICAGLMAYKTGLPVKHFIAACNSNNSFTEYLHSGNFASKQAVATISNAMDVGNPSNFIRITELFGNDFESLKSMISSFSISDDETSNTITRVFKEEDYLLDPHGAVAFAALEKYQQNHSAEKGIILETAHPVKFSNVVESLTNTNIEVPDAVKYILNKEKKSILTEAKYEALKEYLMKSAS
jgi:threonine synthase